MADQNLTTDAALPLAISSLKWCRKGEHLAPLAEFGRLARAKDGLRNTCKECRRIQDAAEVPRQRRLYRERNKERITAYQKSYRQKNAKRLNRARQEYCKKNKARVAGWQRTSHTRQREERLIKFKEYRGKNKSYFQAYAKKYYSDNRDKIINRSLERYWANPESRRQDLKAYYEANKSQYLDYGRNRRARKRAADGQFTREQWIAKCEYWGWRCYLCDSQLTLLTATADHRQPLTRGGSNWIANIAPACFSCNASKQDMPESEYRASRQNVFWLASKRSYPKLSVSFLAVKLSLVFLFNQKCGCRYIQFTCY